MKKNLTSKVAALAATTGLALAALVGVAGTASAAPGDTTTTFILTASGGLSVSPPASAALGSQATGTASITAALGSVTVADARGALLGSWTASVVSGNFTTGAASANETISKTNVSYWSGLATANTGTAVLVPGQLLVANKVAIDTSKTAFSATGVVGNNTAVWDPTVIVTIPSAAVIGTYSGIITHSIA